MSFLQFTGANYESKKGYVFKMEGKNKKTIYKNLVNIPSPIIDTNFKQVFAHNPEITKSLLNSLIYPNDNNIIKVEYLPGELSGKINQYPGEAKLYSFDSLRFDILCKCTLNSGKKEKRKKKKNIKKEKEDDIANLEESLKNFIYENKDEDENKKEEDKILIIDLEMQIGYNIENNRRFIDYAKKLNFKHEDKIIVLSLAFRGFQKPRKNKGFEISLEKKNFPDYKTIEKYDDFVIYQIDLDYCRTIISKKKENIWILDEDQIMNNSSKEWIKYLTLPIWCDSSKKYYYEFPPLERDFFETECVYEAFVILSGQNEETYTNYAEYQEDQEKKIRAYIKLYQDNKDKDKKIEEQIKENKDKDKKIEELIEQIKELKKQNSKNSYEIIKTCKKNNRNNKKNRKTERIK